MSSTQSTHNHLLRYTAAILSAALMAACSSDEPSNAPDKDAVEVSLVLSVEDPSATRASGDTWADYTPKDPGTTEENAINPNDIQIKVCDGTGKLIANVEGITMKRIGDTQYNITGVWRDSADKLWRAKKLMVLANCGEEARSADYADASFLLSNAQTYIPMWGVAPLTDLKLGKSNQVGTVDMLRAMAKVSVHLRSDMAEKGYTIEKLSLNDLNASGYCLPALYYTVDQTRDLPFKGSLHVLDSRVAERDFTQTGYTYVPEYDNTSASAVPSTVSVSLSHNGSHEGTYTLEFRNYDSDGAPSGTPYDIQRNHHYQYTIYKSDDRVIVTLHVRQWNRREHEDVIM